MPRKYEPCIEWERAWTYGDDIPYAVMKESTNGQWVPLKVFVNTTAQLRAENQRLKKMIDSLNGDYDARYINVYGS